MVSTETLPPIPKAAIASLAGVGKTVVLTDMIHNMVGQNNGVSMFCGIGERCREGHELYHDMKKAGKILQAYEVFGNASKENAMKVIIEA